MRTRTSSQSCSQCGTCLEQCPVYRHMRQEQASPKAKHVLLAAAETQDGTPPLTWRQVLGLSRLCVGCERCAAVCPLNLSVPEALAAARSRHPDWVQAAWSLWIGQARYTWPMAKGLASVAPAGLDRLSALLRSARALVGARPAEPWLDMVLPAPPSPAGAALLFAGCTATLARKAWRNKALSLLARAGVEAMAPSFACCGGTLHHAGLVKAYSEAVRTNIGIWESQGRPRLVTVCASCQHALEAYPEGAFASSGQAESWRRAIAPLSGLLLEVGAFVRARGEAPPKVAYHRPCHRTGVDSDLALLRHALPGMSIGRELCCGMGGVFHLTHPALSARLGAICLEGLGAQQGFSILTGCSGCVMQLDAAGMAPVRHWLDAVSL